MNRLLTLPAVSLMVTALLGGCAGMSNNPLVIKMAARFAGAGAAVGTEMSQQDIAQTINYLDKASVILAATMPPDFDKAREMVKEEAPRKYRALLYSAVDMVEMTVGPELEAENPDVEKTREMIVLAIEGFKEGLELSS